MPATQWERCRGAGTEMRIGARVGISKYRQGPKPVVFRTRQGILITLRVVPNQGAFS